MYMENIPHHAERLDDYVYAGGDGDGRVNKLQKGFGRYDVITLALTALWLTRYALSKLLFKLYCV